MPDEPRPNAKPLVSPVETKKSKKKKQKSNAKVAPHGKKKPQKRSKQKQNKSAFGRFFSAIFGAEEKPPQKSKKSSPARQKRGPTKSPRRATSSSKSQGRNVSTSDKSRGNRSKDDQRNKVKPAKRDDKTQRVSGKTNAPIRTPRREKSSGRDKSTRSDQRSSTDSSNKSKTPSDNVRRAADLKQSADAVAREERKSQSASTPNRRAPRSSRTVGTSSKGSTKRHSSLEQSAQRGGETNDVAGREADQKLESKVQSARQTESPANRQKTQAPNQRQVTNRTRSEASDDRTDRDSDIEENQLLAPSPIEPDTSDEAENSIQQNPDTTERQFAANDPRAASQTKGGESAPTAQNVERNKHTPEEKPLSSVTPSNQSDQPSRPEPSATPHDELTPESKQTPETSEVQSSISDEASGSSGRASNDPRSRIGTHS